jgi:hypothetical protein
MKKIRRLGIALVVALVTGTASATTEEVFCNPIPITVPKKATSSFTTYHTYKITNTGATVRNYKLYMKHWTDKYGGEYEQIDRSISVQPGETYHVQHEFNSHFWGNLENRGNFTLLTQTLLEDHKTNKMLKSINCNVPLKVI